MLLEMPINKIKLTLKLIKNNFKILSKNEQPLSIDNSSLLCERPIQYGLANCLVVSICNIIEAKYWQKTGIKLKYDYDSIFNKIDKKNVGLDFSQGINSILKSIQNVDVKISFKLIRNQINSLDKFKALTKSAIHSHQFIILGSMPTIFWKDYHAITICGYDEFQCKLQSTYEHQPRFIDLSFNEIFQNFVIMTCIKI